MLLFFFFVRTIFLFLFCFFRNHKSEKIGVPITQEYNKAIGMKESLTVWISANKLYD